MINNLQKKVLMLALYAGEIMLKSGAEIYRVEDTVARIAKASGVPLVEVFATTTGIFLSLDSGKEEDDTHTFIKRIKGIGIDLEKISRVNTFSREFAETGDVERGFEALTAIDKAPPYKLAWRALGAALIASFYTIMIGGVFRDLFIAFVIGVTAYLLSRSLEHNRTNFFIRNLASCAYITLAALVSIRLGLGYNVGPIIIGSIMMFLPGVAITNAVRDALEGDMVSATARALEATLSAVSIALGVGLVLQIWTAMGGTF